MLGCCLNQALKPQTREGAGLRYKYPGLYLTGYSSLVTHCESRGLGIRGIPASIGQPPASTTGGFCCTVTVEAAQSMPTAKGIAGPHRFYFYCFDCNEPAHAQVRRERMVCKFWIEPVALAQNHGFSAQELNQIRTVIQANLQEIQEAWREHCG